MNSQHGFHWHSVISAYAGMTKKDQSLRSHGFSSFSQNAPRHSRVGRNPLGITVIHTGGSLNQPNLPCLGLFFQVLLFTFQITTFEFKQRNILSGTTYQNIFILSLALLALYITSFYVSSDLSLLP